MKKCLLLVLSLCLFGAPALAGDKAAVLKTDQEKLAYTLGHSLGSSMRQQEMKIDLDKFTLGVKDGLAGGKGLLTEEESRKVMATFQAQMAAKVQAKAAAAAQKNKDDGDKFRAEFAKKKGVKKTASGLLYRVIKSGKGKMPKAGDMVVAHYTGTMVNGKVFDSSVKRGQPAEFPVGGLIKGWQEALVMMKEGDKWQIVLPPELAYGENGAGQVIGPNSTLVFELELIKIKDKEKAKEEKK